MTTAALKQLRACIKIDTLTPAQARVLVAKDVLALLSIGKLDGGGGTYANMHFSEALTNGDLRQEMGHMEKATVCGIGALFVAHVARFDKFKIVVTGNPYCDSSYSINQREIHQHLKEVFPVYMLEEIELAYESDISYDEAAYPETRWAMKYEDAVNRMRGIMRNIIRNAGTFVMSDVR